MIGLDWTQTVTLQQSVSLAFLVVVLLLVLLLAISVYFAVRMKLLRHRVASLEFELKVVAEKVGLLPASKPERSGMEL